MRSGLSIYSSLRQHGHFYTSERQIFIHISLMNYDEIFVLLNVDIFLCGSNFFALVSVTTAQHKVER